MQPANVFEDFTRDISYRIFRRDEKIVLTATMKDLFHDIFVEICVNPEEMKITAARVDFLRQPTNHCHLIDSAMAELVGTTVGKGMNKRLVEIFGGSKGCGNIRTMLLGLLPLALNARAATGIKDQEAMLAKISNELQGTCIGYPINR